MKIKHPIPESVDDAIRQEMHEITRRAAEPRLEGEHTPAAILRAAKMLGIGLRRAKAFWYREKTAVVRAAEVDLMRAAADKASVRRRERLEREAAEDQALVERRRRLEREIAEIEARLDAADEADARAAADRRREKAAGDGQAPGMTGWDSPRGGTESA